LLRIDGRVAGAFDREHETVVVAASGNERELRLEVELASLPTHGLPNGPGARWTLMQRRKAERPRDRIEIVDAPALDIGKMPEDGLPLLAHAHLDLAWLWTFAEGRRKGLRTLANALNIAERAPDYIFIQSQPALYAYAEHDDPELFARIGEAVRRGQIDPSVAAPWVETDCNIPSGETLLRQLVHGMRYVHERFGVVPSVAWLPDTFGFPNTLPQLLAHAGVRFFATAKLQWNDTSRWPHPQFAWLGPDGSGVIGAVLDSYEGGVSPERVAKARERKEALVVGYGDGGGGPNDAIVREASAHGRWTSARAWFESIAANADKLPRFAGELYLETHRGVWTTHHDVKARRFTLEAALDEAEELVAWCMAVRASSNLTAPLSADLRTAWPPLLRGDFHDVVCGTSIGPVYEELALDYERVERVCARVGEAAYSLLPRAKLGGGSDEIVPREDDDAYVLENAHLYARVRRDGTIVALHRPEDPNLVTAANVLRAYVDRPKEWEAWNIDASYVRRPVRLRPSGSDIEDGALVVRYRVRGSTIVVRLALGTDDPYLRADAAVLWEEERTLLRVENWLASEAPHVTFGTPHGTLDRATSMQTREERAKFEVPAQRFARLDGPQGGFALLATDNYGWNARSLGRGGTHIGLSLLRSPLWPDPNADQGEHRLSWALAPLAPATGIGALEQAWRGFAYPQRVRLFTCQDPAVLVVACKPADDDEGIVVRVRECDGSARKMRLQFGGRARSVESCDARERMLEREVALDDGALVAGLEPYELRTFRVRL
jgi:alpha-mannosidase